MPVGQMPVGRMPVGRMPVGRMSVCRMSAKIISALSFNCIGEKNSSLAGITTRRKKGEPRLKQKPRDSSFNYQIKKIGPLTICMTALVIMTVSIIKPGIKVSACKIQQSTYIIHYNDTQHNNTQHKTQHNIQHNTQHNNTQHNTHHNCNKYIYSTYNTQHTALSITTFNLVSPRIMTLGDTIAQHNDTLYNNI
jgi:hypothetical protein